MPLPPIIIKNQFSQKKVCKIYRNNALVLFFRFRFYFLFGSLELIVYPYLGSQGELIVYPCSVVHRRPSQCLNISSETPGPIKAKLHMEHT